MSQDIAKPIAKGDRFGRLVAVRFLSQSPRARWLFRCDCGQATEALVKSAKSGNTKSCGCLQREAASEVGRISHRGINQTHGMSSSPEYRAWRRMIARCEAKAGSGYRYYGARGIKICDRWRNSFEAFLADMGPKPSPKHSIDRIDNDGPYTPKNCRWATAQEQANNRQNNHIVIYRGRTITLSNAMRAAGVDVAANRLTVYKRLKRGWPVERAVETPSRSRLR